MDNELLLYDRLEVIKATNQKYDLATNEDISAMVITMVLPYLLLILLFK